MRSCGGPRTEAGGHRREIGAHQLIVPTARHGSERVRCRGAFREKLRRLATWRFIIERPDGSRGLLSLYNIRGFLKNERGGNTGAINCFVTSTGDAAEQEEFGEAGSASAHGRNMRKRYYRHSRRLLHVDYMNQQWFGEVTGSSFNEIGLGWDSVYPF